MATYVTIEDVECDSTISYPKDSSIQQYWIHFKYDKNLWYNNTRDNAVERMLPTISPRIYAPYLSKRVYVNPKKHCVKPQIQRKVYYPLVDNAQQFAQNNLAINWVKPVLQTINKERRRINTFKKPFLKPSFPKGEKIYSIFEKPSFTRNITSFLRNEPLPIMTPIDFKIWQQLRLKTFNTPKNYRSNFSLEGLSAIFDNWIMKLIQPYIDKLKLKVDAISLVASMTAHILSLLDSFTNGTNWGFLKVTSVIANIIAILTNIAKILMDNGIKFALDTVKTWLASCFPSLQTFLYSSEVLPQDEDPQPWTVVTKRGKRIRSNSKTVVTGFATIFLISFFVGISGTGIPINKVTKLGAYMTACLAAMNLFKAGSTDITNMFSHFIETELVGQALVAKDILDESNHYLALPTYKFFSGEGYPLQRIRALPDEITNLLAKPPKKDDPSYSAYTSLTRPLSLILSSINQKLVCLNQLDACDLRPMPLVTVFSGPPNVGKSILTQYVRSRIAKHLDITPKAYNLKTNGKHWETWRGEKFAYSDEFLMNIKDPLNDIMNALASPARINLQGADIADKKQYVDFVSIMLNTNAVETSLPALSTLEKQSKAPFWDRLNWFKVEDPERLDRSATNAYARATRNLPGDFSNLKLILHEYENGTYKPVLKNQKLLTISPNQFADWCTKEIISRQIECFKQMHNSADEDLKPSITEMYLDYRRVHNPIYSKLSNPFSLNDIPLPLLSNTNETSVEPFVVRFEGDPGNGKSFTRRELTTTFKTLFDMPVHVYNDIRKAQKPDTTSFIVLDDCIKTSEEQSMYVEFFNSLAGPHIILIITNEILLNKSWKYPMTDCYIPVEGGLNAYARRCGAAGRIKTLDRTFRVLDDRNMLFSFDNSLIVKHPTIGNVHTTEILKCVTSQYQYYLRTKDAMVEMTSEAPIVTYDLELEASTYADLVLVMSSPTKILSALATQTDGVKLTVNPSFLVLYKNLDIKEFVLAEIPTFDKFMHSVRTMLYKVRRQYPEAKIRIKVGEHEYKVHGNKMFVPSDIHKVKVTQLNAIYEIRNGLEVSMYNRDDLAKIIADKDFGKIPATIQAYIVDNMVRTVDTNLSDRVEYFKGISTIKTASQDKSSLLTPTILGGIGILLGLAGLIGLAVNYFSKGKSKHIKSNVFANSEEYNTYVEDLRTYERAMDVGGPTYMDAHNLKYQTNDNYRRYVDRQENVYDPVGSSMPSNLYSNTMPIEELWKHMKGNEKARALLISAFPEHPFIQNKRYILEIPNVVQTHEHKDLHFDGKPYKHSHSCEVCHRIYQHTHTKKTLDQSLSYGKHLCDTCRATYRSNMVDKNMRVNKRFDDYQQIAEMCQKNTISLGNNYGLMTHDRYGITVAHCFAFTNKIRANFVTPLGPVTCDAVAYAIHPETDKAYFKLEGRQVPAFKDIRNHFLDEYEYGTYNNVAFVRSLDIISIIPGQATLKPKIRIKETNESLPTVGLVHDKEQQFEYIPTYMTSMEDVILHGDCGLPLLLKTRDRTVIAAIHNGVGEYDALFSLVTKPDLEKALRSNVNSKLVNNELIDKFHNIKEVYVPEILLSALQYCEPSARQVNGNRFKVYGDNPRFKTYDIRNTRKDHGILLKAPNLNNLTDARPAAMFPEDVIDPSKLWRDQDGKIDIGFTNIMHIFEPPITPNLNKEAFEIMTNIYCDYIQTNFSKFNILSDSEMINGFYQETHKLVDGVAPLKMDSSAGPIYKHCHNIKKKGELFVNVNENLKGRPHYKYANTILAKDLEKQVNIELELILQGIPALQDMEYHKKVELRPKAKVAEGKTRLYSCLGVKGTLIMRKLLGSYIGQCYHNRQHLSSQLGINPYTEFTHVEKEMASLDNEYYHDMKLDHEKFDKMVKWHCYDVLAKALGNHSIDLTYENYKTLFISIVSSICIYDTTFFQKIDAVDSGIAGTTVIDCAVVKMKNYYIYARCLQKKYQVIPQVMLTTRKAEDVVRTKSYGDDDYSKLRKDMVSKEDIFSFTREFGFIVTESGKGNSEEDNTFMSRKIELTPEGVCYPSLKKSSINRMYQWVPSMSKDQIALNWNAALWEASLWDEKYFNDVVSDLRSLNDRYKLNVLKLLFPPNFKQVRNMFFEYVRYRAPYGNRVLRKTLRNQDVLENSSIIDIESLSKFTFKNIQSNSKMNSLESTSNPVSWYNELQMKPFFRDMKLETTYEKKGEDHIPTWFCTIEWKFQDYDKIIVNKASEKKMAQRLVYEELKEFIILTFPDQFPPTPIITTVSSEDSTQEKLIRSNSAMPNNDNNFGTSVNPVQAGGGNMSTPNFVPPPPPPNPVTPQSIDRPTDPQVVANIDMPSQKAGMVQLIGPLDTSFYNVNTRNLVHHAYQDLDSDQLIVVNGSDQPGKIIATIPYGPNPYLNPAAKTWLSLHKYFGGSIDYTIHQAAVPMIKGEIIWAYMTRTPKPNEIIRMAELQKIDWNTDAVSGTNVFTHTLYDRRREKFYRAMSDFPGDDDFRAELPCIVGVVHITPENQFPEGTSQITFRVRSKLSSMGAFPFQAFDVDFNNLDTNALLFSTPLNSLLSVQPDKKFYISTDGNTIPLTPKTVYTDQMDYNPDITMFSMTPLGDSGIGFGSTALEPYTDTFYQWYVFCSDKGRLLRRGSMDGTTPNVGMFSPITPTFTGVFDNEKPLVVYDYELPSPQPISTYFTYVDTDFGGEITKIRLIVFQDCYILTILATKQVLAGAVSLVGYASGIDSDAEMPGLPPALIVSYSSAVPEPNGFKRLCMWPSALPNVSGPTAPFQTVPHIPALRNRLDYECQIKNTPCIDFTMTNRLNGAAVAYVRYDSLTKEMYIKSTTEFNHAVSVVTSDNIDINSIVPSTMSNNLQVTNDTGYLPRFVARADNYFKQAKLYRSNFWQALAGIGGGLLQGVGQGINAHVDRKHQMAMQNDRQEFEAEMFGAMQGHQMNMINTNFNNNVALGGIMHEQRRDITNLQHTNNMGYQAQQFANDIVKQGNEFDFRKRAQRQDYLFRLGMMNAGSRANTMYT